MRVAHLQFVLVLFVDLSQQLCFAAGQGLDEGVALRHQTGLELNAVLLQHSEEVGGERSETVNENAGDGGDERDAISVTASHSHILPMTRPPPPAVTQRLISTHLLHKLTAAFCLNTQQSAGSILTVMLTVSPIIHD